MSLLDGGEPVDVPPDYDAQVRAVMAAMAARAASGPNGGALPSLAAAAVLALRDYRRATAKPQAAATPWGHSQAAHALLGWCAHCDGVTAADEAVGWREFAVTGEPPAPPPPAAHPAESRGHHGG